MPRLRVGRYRSAIHRWSPVISTRTASRVGMLPAATNARISAVVGRVSGRSETDVITKTNHC